MSLDVKDEMSFDEQRNRICLQCLKEEKLEEGNRRLLTQAIEAVVYNIDTHREWKNEVYWRNGKNGNWSWYDKLCCDCPYVLEHVVLSDSEIRMSTSK